jgi:putative DNA primase/helicase
LHKIDKAFLKTDLTRCIDFHHIAKGGAIEPCGPNDDLVSSILSRYGNWQFPVVSGVITSPTLRPDGSVLATEGYDPATGLLVVGPLPRMPRLSGRPSREEAERALATLEGLLTEFPFCDGGSKSAALSGLITVNVRGMMDCVPLHASSAPAPGTGKSFLFDVCAVVPSGDAMPIMAQGPNGEETEKRLNAEIEKGLPFFSIDNVTAPLGGDCLCQAIERPSYTYRYLGFTRMRSRKNVWTMFASGNNLRVRDDLTRRALLIRMDAGMENPETRVFASNPFLTAQENRGRYIAAALTIVRAYMSAGRPGLLPSIGDPFLQWSDNVRSALVWLGKVDPVETMEEGRENDPRRQSRMAMFQAIYNTYGGKSRTAGQMVADAKAGLLIPPSGKLADGVASANAAALRDAIIAYADAKLDAQHLGRMLAIDKDKITDGLVLRSTPDTHNKVNIWHVERCDGG